ncbi:hypothetical protein DRJ17_05055 [Candidatus Woesearchaeota archaeon]|nr:MAG: hypothetical protein DRJ17_05055 [Candidatus Woesearchaeota archaeon]
MSKVAKSVKKVKVGEAYHKIKPILYVLEAHPSIEVYQIAGSYRRGKEIIKDMDIVAKIETNENTEDIIRKICEMSEDFEKGVIGRDRVRRKFNGIQFDLHFAREGEWGARLLYLTGSAEFNIDMRTIAKRMGFLLNEYGLFKRDTGELVASVTEEEIFEALNMDFVDPKDREKTAAWKAIKQDHKDKGAKKNGTCKTKS